jgi:hypothetical protein
MTWESLLGLSKINKDYGVENVSNLEGKTKL